MKTGVRRLKVALPVVALFMATAAADAQVKVQPSPADSQIPPQVRAADAAQLQGRADRQIVRDRMAERSLSTQPPVNRLALYGRPRFGVATPFPTPADDFYSGARSRPCDFNRWYGNGYNW